MVIPASVGMKPSLVQSYQLAMKHYQSLLHNPFFFELSTLYLALSLVGSLRLLLALHTNKGGALKSLVNLFE
jgi:hypothetical protein